MAIDKILISSSPGETRIALVDDGRLCDLVVERPDLMSLVGNVYAGRVERLASGIQAAFVGIGLERAGFLAASEARPASEAPGEAPGEAPREAPREAPGEPVGAIGDYVSEGDKVLVQVRRDPFEDKGAKLSTNITLAGRFLVYAPGQGGDEGDIKLSRRIEDGAARAHLIGLLEGRVEGRVEGGEGFIVRTAAVNANDGELFQDIESLRAAWRKIEDMRAGATPPACLHREPGAVGKILRDEGTASVAKIIADNPRALAEVRETCRRLAPDLADRIELHGGPLDLFEDHGIEEQIERALAPAVGLASGGSIIISETAALTAIDVNIGAAAEGGAHQETALAVNLEAADEIARQIRLRNLAGLIAIDFVSMKRHAYNAEVLERLRRALADDPIPAYVGGFTRLGLVEMTRPRRRDSLSRVLGGPCPVCDGAGNLKSPLSVAHEALRAAGREAKSARCTGGAALTLRASPAVVGALKVAAADALGEAEERLGQPLQLIADETMAADGFEIAEAKSGGKSHD